MTSSNATSRLTDAPPKTDDGTTITIRVGTPLEEVERRVTMATLAYCGHVKRKAAEILGVSLKTLYNRLETYNGKDSGRPALVGAARRRSAESRSGFAALRAPRRTIPTVRCVAAPVAAFRDSP